MRPYGGKNLRFVEDRQYSGFHTGIAMPSSGHNRGERRKRINRPFKKMTRQGAKKEIYREFEMLEEFILDPNNPELYCNHICWGKHGKCEALEKGWCKGIV